jgi:hypothetical protein
MQLGTKLSMGWWMGTRIRITLWYVITFSLVLHCFGIFWRSGCIQQGLARLIVRGGLVFCLLIQRRQLWYHMHASNKLAIIILVWQQTDFHFVHYFYFTSAIFATWWHLISHLEIPKANVLLRAHAWSWCARSIPWILYFANAWS